jgi:hypothetical protein
LGEKYEKGIPVRQGGNMKGKEERGKKTRKFYIKG